MRRIPTISDGCFYRMCMLSGCHADFPKNGRPLLSSRCSWTRLHYSSIMQCVGFLRYQTSALTECVHCLDAVLISPKMVGHYCHQDIPGPGCTTVTLYSASDCTLTSCNWVVIMFQPSTSDARILGLHHATPFPHVWSTDAVPLA